MSTFFGFVLFFESQITSIELADSDSDGGQRCGVELCCVVLCCVVSYCIVLYDVVPQELALAQSYYPIIHPMLSVIFFSNIRSPKKSDHSSFMES